MKKVLSVLIALVMVLALMPMTVFADPPLPSSLYDVWVGGIRVTSDNSDNVTGEGISTAEGGNVKYDVVSNTLTLTDADITGSYVYDPSTLADAGIYSKNINLKIKLEGSNKISGGSYLLIYAEDGSVDISGDGSLELTSSTARGIRSYNTIKISGCELSINTGKYGILGNDVTIQNSEVDVKTTIDESELTGSDGITGTNSLTISNSKVDVDCAGVTALWGENSLTVSGSEINVTKSEIALRSDNGSTTISNSDLTCKGQINGHSSLTLTGTSVTKPEGGKIEFISDLYHYYVCTDDGEGTLTPSSDIEIRKDCTVSVTASPSTGGTVNGAGKYTSGQEVTVTATADTSGGFIFSNWTENGKEVSADAEYTFTVTDNRNLIASFVDAEYTITASSSSETAGTVTGGGVFPKGRSVTVTATANEGYSFVNWTDENNAAVSSDAVYTFSAYSNKTLKANFEINTYTITISSAGNGTVSGNDSNPYEYGSSITLKAETDVEGYHFINWTEGEDVVSTDAEYTFTVNADRTLVANFSNQYTIRFVNDNGDELQKSDWTYGETPSYTATPNPPVKPSSPQYSYNFIGWDSEPSEVTEDKTYTAVYESVINKYVISATSSGNGSAMGSGSIDFGASATVTANADEGYHFVNWTENGTEVSTNSSYTFTVEGERSLKANFAINTYSIRFVAEDGTVLEEYVLEHGQMPKFAGLLDPTKEATAKYTYTFAGWRDKVTKSPIVPAAGNVDYEPTFTSTINQYTIKFVNEGGTILQSSLVNYGEVPAYLGSTPTKASTAQFSYTFKGWDKTIIPVTEDAVYTATFDSKKFEQKANVTYYTVTFEVNGGDAVEAQKIEAGQTASKPKDPYRDRFNFGGWYKDAELTQPFSFSTVINADTTVYAKWVAGNEQIEITYAVIGDNNIEWVRGSGEDLVIGIERSQDDDTSVDHFRGILIDGEEFYNYDISDDRVTITISADKMETLTNSQYEVIILFDDGQADLQLRVEATPSTPTTAETAETGAPTESDNGTEKGQGGKANLTGLWIALAIVGGVVLCALPIFIIRRRK